MKNLISYLKNVRAEMKHVVWPSWKVGIAHTFLIILISAAFGIYIAGLDYVLTSGVNAIVTR